MDEATKEVIETAGATIGEAAKEMVSKGFALLDQLAAKIGVTVEYLWPFMIKEHIVQAITSIILLVVSAIGMFISCKFIKFMEDEKGGTVLECTPRAIIAAIAACVFAIAALIGFISAWSNLPGLLNPEYHALKDLINMVK